MTSAHEIVWTFERDYVDAWVACNDEECVYRYLCPQECEIIYAPRRLEDGRVVHSTWNESGDDLTGEPHEMVKGGVCEVVEALHADTTLIPELSEGRETFELARTPFTPVWDPDDGVRWKRADA